MRGGRVMEKDTLAALIEERRRINAMIREERERRIASSDGLTEFRRVKYSTGKIDWNLVIKSKTTDYSKPDNIGYRVVSVKLDTWAEDNPKVAISFLKDIVRSLSELVPTVEKQYGLTEENEQTGGES